MSGPKRAADTGPNHRVNAGNWFLDEGIVIGAISVKDGRSGTVSRSALAENIKYLCL